MKTSLYFCLLALLASLQLQQAYAQKLTSGQPQTTFHSGSWQLGAKAGYGRGNLLSNRNSFQIHAGYFPIKQLAVGLNATWSNEWVDDIGFKDLSAGPYIRYQFTATWLSPFVEASYQMGRRSSDAAGVSYPSTPMQTIQLGPGLSIETIKFLRLDLSYRFDWVYLTNNTQTVGLPQIGLTYLFR
ncbi:hypothetical protein [Spirosoma flavum]|uniref:Outer membrane protein beta-barrel domain-containing protein n=1 Tax=Spirosoma flavum TaxID=2048557 RepID=A0ABW6AVN1_9BACT